jgi:hypothetical protein
VYDDVNKAYTKIFRYLMKAEGSRNREYWNPLIGHALSFSSCAAAKFLSIPEKHWGTEI